MDVCVQGGRFGGCGLVGEFRHSGMEEFPGGAAELGFYGFVADFGGDGGAFEEGRIDSWGGRRVGRFGAGPCERWGGRAIGEKGGDEEEGCDGGEDEEKTAVGHTPDYSDGTFFRFVRSIPGKNRRRRRKRKC